MGKYECGFGTRRRPKRTGLCRGYRWGLRPVGAIGAYSPTRRARVYEPEAAPEGRGKDEADGA